MQQSLTTQALDPTNTPLTVAVRSLLGRRPPAALTSHWTQSLQQCHPLQKRPPSMTTTSGGTSSGHQRALDFRNHVAAPTVLADVRRPCPIDAPTQTNNHTDNKYTHNQLLSTTTQTDIIAHIFGLHHRQAQAWQALSTSGL